MIVDAHTHFGKVNNQEFTPEQLIKSMDEAGIEYSLLLADYFANRGTSTQKIIEATKKFPRLKAIGNITCATLDDSQIKTIQEYIKNKEVVGIKFYLGYEQFYPTNENFFPIYETCIKYNVPVVFHTGILLGELKGLLKYSHPLNIDELASRFPELNIIIAHMGNPWLVDCAAVVSRNKNVYVDCSGYFKEFSPIDSEEENFFIEQMRQFKLFVGDFKKVLFGTDWPIYSQKEYLKAVMSVPMTAEERDLVFYKNAKNIFHI